MGNTELSKNYNRRTMRTFAVAMIALLTVSTQGVSIRWDRRDDCGEECRQERARRDFERTQMLAGLAPFDESVIQTYLPDRRAPSRSLTGGRQRLRDEVADVADRFRDMVGRDEEEEEEARDAAEARIAEAKQRAIEQAEARAAARAEAVKFGREAFGRFGVRGDVDVDAGVDVDVTGVDTSATVDVTGGVTGSATVDVTGGVTQSTQSVSVDSGSAATGVSGGATFSLGAGVAGNAQAIELLLRLGANGTFVLTLPAGAAGNA